MESVKLALKGGPREINGENEKIFHWPIVTEEEGSHCRWRQTELHGHYNGI